MMDIVIDIVTKDTGLLIGLALLIVASFYLPKKVRIHVLTAGISIILYQIGKNYYFRKQYAETEEERIRLKAEKAELEAQGKTLLEELTGLKEQSRALDKEIADLREEKERLRSSDNFDPNEFDDRINTLREESQTLEEKIRGLPVISKQIGETIHQLDSATQ